MRQRQQDYPTHGTAVGDRQQDHREEHQTQHQPEYRREQAWQDFMQNMQEQNNHLANELRDAASAGTDTSTLSWMQERDRNNCQRRWDDLRHALHHPETHHIPEDLKHDVAHQVVSAMNHPVLQDIQDLQHQLHQSGDPSDHPQPFHQQSWSHLTQLALHRGQLDLDTAQDTMTAWLDGSRDQELRQDKQQLRGRGAHTDTDPYHSAMHNLHQSAALMQAALQHARVDHLVTPQGHYTQETLELLEERNQAMLQDFREFIQQRHPHPPVNDHDLVTHPEFIRDFRDFAQAHMPGDTDRLAHHLAQAPTNREMRQMGFIGKKTSNLRDDLAHALSDRPAWLVDQWQQNHPGEQHPQEQQDHYAHLTTGPVMEDFLQNLKKQDFQLWLEMERLTSPQGNRGPALWDRADNLHPADSRRRTDQLLQGLTSTQQNMEHHHPNTLNNLSHRTADIITIHAQETTARFTDVGTRGTDFLQDPGCNNPPDLLDPQGYNDLTALLQRNTRDVMAYSRNHIARSTREQNAADLNYHINLMNDTVRELEAFTHGRSEPWDFIHLTTYKQYLTLRDERTQLVVQEFQKQEEHQAPSEPWEWGKNDQLAWEQILPNITLQDANMLLDHLQQQHDHQTNPDPGTPEAHQHSQTQTSIDEARQQARQLAAGVPRE